MKRCNLLLCILTLILLTSCIGGDRGVICDLPLVPQRALQITLTNEDTRQLLIGDWPGGSIYNHWEVVIYFDGKVKDEPILQYNNINVDDWHSTLSVDTLLSLEYVLELPHNGIPNRIDRDTLLVEYQLREPPNCQVPYTEETREMTFVRLTYNEVVHYEGIPKSVLPILLDRI